MWLYYITDRTQLGHTPAEQNRRLLEKIGEAARCGVDFIQLREKDLSSRELENLAREAAAVVRQNSAGAGASPGVTQSRLLINSRVDVAISSGADGVHLPAGDLTPIEARTIWDTSASSRRQPPPQAVIGVSCHSTEDVRLAQVQGADFSVFAPVFEKVMTRTAHKQPGAGLEALRVACEQQPAKRDSPKFPVFALGGVTFENAQQCLQAGAVGVAGIRLFQQNEVKWIVDRLRNLQ